MFNEVYSPEEAEEKLLQWLKEFGYHSAERSEISMRAHSESVTEIMKQNNDIVVNQMHAKGIPTMIYKNHKHTGKYEAK
jgi:sensor histidine kinase YesM